MGILGELDRAGLLNRDVAMVHAPSLEHALSRNDISAPTAARCANSSPPRRAACRRRSRSAKPRATTIDEDREKGVIRDYEHAFSKDGGLAVLYGNIAIEGCIVKTAGVDSSILKFEGPVKIFESQDDAVPAF